MLFFFLTFFLLPRAEIAKNVPSATTTTNTTINFERKLRQVELKVKPTNEDEAGMAWEHSCIHMLECMCDVWPITQAAHTHARTYIKQTEL